jgi:hypothetical protein
MRSATPRAMAESILLHFRSASAQDVLRRIAPVAEKATDRELYSYPPGDDYLLLISTYEDYATEYDEDQRAELERMLESRPHGSLDFELRRSRSDAACDAALEIVRKLSAEFSFVVDDCDRFWRANEAISSSHFLDQYRYAKRA